MENIKFVHIIEVILINKGYSSELGYWNYQRQLLEKWTRLD